MIKGKGPLFRKIETNPYSSGCSKKKSMLHVRTRFFQLIKCIRCQFSSLKKKMWSKPWNCEIGQQMLKFQKLLNVDEICIFSTPIFIFSIKPIKIKSIIHIWNVLKWINQFLKLFWHIFVKKSSQILFRVEMDRQRRRYTNSRDSGMDWKKPLKIYFVLSF